MNKKMSHVVTSAEMRQLDKGAIRIFGIPSLILMENAGRSAADSALRMLKKPWEKRTVTVLAGPGNNGGDGLVAARHLMNRGIRVSIFLAGSESDLKGDPRINFHILDNMKANMTCVSGEAWEIKVLAKRIKESQLIIDALFGTGLSKILGEPYSSIVKLVNKSRRPVLSIDIPSGLNGDTGEVMGVTIHASQTITLAVPKAGLFQGKGPECSGKIEIGDISMPRILLRKSS